MKSLMLYCWSVCLVLLVMLLMFAVVVSCDRRQMFDDPYEGREYVPFVGYRADGDVVDLSSARGFDYFIREDGLRIVRVCDCGEYFPAFLNVVYDAGEADASALSFYMYRLSVPDHVRDGVAGVWYFNLDHGDE